MSSSSLFFFFSSRRRHTRWNCDWSSDVCSSDLGCAVSCPEGQLCCGMPYLDGGDLDAARAHARRNLDALLPLVKAGADVVVRQPTCSYVLKKEYPLLVPGEAAHALAAKTFDTFEFLVNRHREGHLAADFKGRSP